MVSQDSWVIKMGLNNIQRSKQKVLNRPMFAKMKDGTIKPVQYHWIGAAINVGSKVAPYVGRYGVKPLWGAAKKGCLLYTSPSPRDGLLSRMPSSA